MSDEIKIASSATSSKRHIITPVFGKYVTRNVGFVNHLRAIREQINNYISKVSVRRPLNILLAAPPGSGKSFLIKQLIESLETTNSELEVSFEEIYVASLEGISDLYNIFQRVQSLNLGGKLPVVFFDEIDTEVNGQALYPKFLAPMWDGTFYIGKDKHYLGRSIFFFAGSTLSQEEDSKHILDNWNDPTPMSYEQYYSEWETRFQKWCEASNGKDPKTIKLLDFMDRIDAIIRIPPLHKALLSEELLQMEYEDIVFMLIRKHFPKANNIGKAATEVLTQFLTNSRSMRPVEKLIFSANQSDPDTFDISCLPARTQESLTDLEACLVNGREREIFSIEVKKPSSVRTPLKRLRLKRYTRPRR
ncbi:MAG: ATP-binding protein [Hyphomicrobiaceae bacterium]